MGELVNMIISMVAKKKNIRNFIIWIRTVSSCVPPAELVEQGANTKVMYVLCTFLCKNKLNYVLVAYYDVVKMA